MRQLVVESRTAGGDVSAMYGEIIFGAYVTAIPEEQIELRLLLTERELQRGRRAIFATVGPLVRVTGDDQRNRLAALYQRHESSIIGVAAVYFNHGFLAAAHRSAWTGI